MARLFAQVLQNSAYTYALVLSTFLLALAIGSGVANALSRSRRADPELVLGILLVLAAVAMAASPWAFHAVTDGLAYVGSDLAWGAYVVAGAGVAGLVMLLPALGAWRSLVVLAAVYPVLVLAVALTRLQPSAWSWPAGDARGCEEETRSYLDDFLERSPEEVSGAGDVSPARRLLDPILAPLPRT